MANVRSRSTRTRTANVRSRRGDAVITAGVQFVAEGADQAVEQIKTLEVATNQAEVSAQQVATTYGEWRVALDQINKQIRELKKNEQLNADQQRELADLYNQQKNTQEELAIAKDRAALAGEQGTRSQIAALAKEEGAQRRIIELMGARARLYGDIESRSLAVLGAAGQFGFAGLEGAGRYGTELLAAAEGIQLLQVELPPFIQNLGWTQESFVALGGALTVVGVAAYALTSFFREQQAEAKQLQENMDKAVELQGEFTEIAQTATQADIQARIDEYQTQKDLAIARRNQLLEDEAAIKAAGEALFGLGAPGKVVIAGEVITNFAELDAVSQSVAADMDAVNQELEDIDDNLTIFTDGLTDWRVIANTTEQALADAKTAELARIQSEYELAQVLAQTNNANSMSLEEYRQTMSDLGDEYELNQRLSWELNRALSEGRISREEAIPIITELNLQIKTSALLMDAYAMQFDEFTKILNNGVNTLLDGIGSFNQVGAAIGGLAADFAADSQKGWDDFLKAWEDYQIELSRLQEDYNLARARALEDHLRELADLDRKYADDQKKIQDKIAEDERAAEQEKRDRLAEFLLNEQRELEDHRDRLLQIRERMNRSIQEASAKLDAYAIWQAQRRAEEEARNEIAEYEKQKQRRLEDFLLEEDQRQKDRKEKLRKYKQDLDDLRNKHAQERAEMIRQFNEEQRRDAEDHQIRLRRMWEDFVREQQLANQAFEARYGIEQFWWGELNLQASANMATLVTTVNTALANITLAQNMPQIQATTQSAIDNLIGILDTGSQGSVQGTAIVGGNGPEIVRFNNPARVYASGMGHRINSNITNNFQQTGRMSQRHLQKMINTGIDKTLGNILG